MNITLQRPKTLRCTPLLPASKSISNRALIVSALSASDVADAALLLQNISDCDDTKVICRALQQPSETIDIMAAGTAMRFLTAYYSITSGTRTLTGTERMRHRPISVLVEALRNLGADIRYTDEEGFPPLQISGSNLKGGKLELSGSISSQYISALLMIGPKLNGGLQLQLDGEIVSRPYIDMTLQIMRHFGAEAQWNGERTIVVHQGKYQQRHYLIESDWSAASYWYEMVALADDSEAEVILPGLFKESLQGDCAIKDIFKELGVQTEHFCDRNHVPCVRLTKNGHIANHIEIHLVNQPDLAQTLVVTCAMLGVPFRFTGLQSLKIKETDRIVALRTELRKLGYNISEENEDTLFWNGERCKKDAVPAIDTYDDHRMALALAPACLKHDTIHIREAQVINKSYPNYWLHLQNAAFPVHNS